MKKKRDNIIEFSSYSSSETESIARQIGSSLKPGSVVALIGNLGAGKTTFVRGLAQAIGIREEGVVSSPTFSYLNIYHGSLTLFHLDLYRLSSEEAFLESGFAEYFSLGGISCVEWPDIALNFLPKNTLFIELAASRFEEIRTIHVRENL